MKSLPLFFLVLLLAVGGCAAPKKTTTPSPADDVRLVELMAQRLEVAREVAWVKFQNNLPVRDPKREAELLGSLTNRAGALGVSPKVAERFFSAQIRASCRVQEELMRYWEHGGTLPALPPRDLRHDIRPRLDVLSQALLEELAAVSRGPRKPGLAGSARNVLRERGFSPAVAGMAAAPLSRL